MKIRFLIIFSILSLAISAKSIGLILSYNTYLSAEGNTYLEVYYLLDPLSLKFIQDGKSYQGEVEITLTFSQGENIVNYDKLKIPVLLTDTLESSPYIQQSRIQLDTGVYQMDLWLKDVNLEAEPIHLSQDFSIDFDFLTPHFSAPLFLDNFEKTTEENEFSKGGYDLYPNITPGTPYFHDGYKKLSFYIELYNSQMLNKEEPFLFKYYIRNENTSEILNEYAGFSKKKTGLIVPLLNSFNISNLRTGNYSLVIKAINQNNKEIAKDSTFFYRYKEDGQNYDYEHMASLDITASFVEKLNDMDTLYRYIDCLYPISTPLETRYAENQKRERNIENMQRYFLSFWKKRDMLDPQSSWEDYYKTVKQIDKKYRTPIMPGYKTARGRVFLQYGPPYQIESFPSDPRVLPYEIWQYDQLESASTTYQVNKVFIFINYILGSNDYELAHSSAVGEMYDPAWKLRLQKRDFQSHNVDDYNSPSDIDRSGSRYDNNIIIGK